MPLIQVIVSQVMNLKPQLIDSSKVFFYHRHLIDFILCFILLNFDVKAIARLFADMGDSYVELIATDNKARLVIHGFIKKVLYEK
uniref:Uncharacterized protein n=1 Tax=Helianthus annuus TaxID=4232 RepID=A0A251TS34_HELAN